VNNQLDIKENNERALDFALHLSRLFQSRWVWALRVQLVLSSLNACLLIAKVFTALFSRSAQNLMLFLCQVHSENT
jgi:hypothetical protein